MLEVVSNGVLSTGWIGKIQLLPDGGKEISEGGLKLIIWVVI
jgi:hypothetical protein